MSKAQLEMIQADGYAKRPYYWAPFILLAIGCNRKPPRSLNGVEGNPVGCHCNAPSLG